MDDSQLKIDFATGVAHGGGWHDGGRVEITRDWR